MWFKPPKKGKQNQTTFVLEYISLYTNDLEYVISKQYTHMNVFSKVAGYKTNTQNSMVYLH
jgi:hypothetical protein